MKYVVILGDGWADYPLDKLNGKTPLSVANKPNIDALAVKSEVGLCKTVPNALKPGSDVANLAVLGYDPKAYYTGRSPLEAASIGIDLTDTDVTARANLVTLSDEDNFEDKTMLDYSAGEISTAESRELIAYLKTHLDTDGLKLYSGVSYRHCLVIDNGVVTNDLTPPHDITDKKIAPYLPKNDNSAFYLELMKRSVELLKDHPINKQRILSGKRPANSLWFWGEGTKPRLDSFFDKYGVKGAMISAVDLLKGIAKLAGMDNIEVEGATGNWDTNFLGKANACLDALKNGKDFVYIHMEAPDECGHQGNLDKKIYSIEQIDSKVVKTLINGLDALGEDYALLIMPDHPTPIALKTHVKDPVPYLLYRSNYNYPSTVTTYSEESASKTGNFIEDGYTLMAKFLH
ncbi:MAG: cofactor-independent phosphoglycerate mutase [Clostridia bacterium]|nr:cofactor-independent phosphoglycerate mutase [Clostridia bacterium]